VSVIASQAECRSGIICRAPRIAWEQSSRTEAIKQTLTI
jgi:hypothetical protein